MPPFRSLMYAYVQAFLEQVLVSVACNGAHSLKQRLARWLSRCATAVTTMLADHPGFARRNTGSTKADHNE